MNYHNRVSKVIKVKAVTNRGEEVDGESWVCRIVSREDPVEGLLQRRVADPVDQLAHAHVFGQLLKENMINCE